MLARCGAWIRAGERQRPRHKSSRTLTSHRSGCPSGRDAFPVDTSWVEAELHTSQHRVMSERYRRDRWPLRVERMVMLHTDRQLGRGRLAQA